MWSISTILTGLCSFMLGKDKTLGSIESTDGQKRLLARKSLEFNVKDKNFCNLFPEYVELWKEREEEERKARESGRSEGKMEEDMMKAVVPSGDTFGEGNIIIAFGAGIVALLSILFAIRFF